jgi:hypothetical protein
VILIMIGAIAYFGILNPEEVLLPNRCTTSPEFSCNDYLITASNGMVSVNLKQGIGKTIYVNGAGCTYEDQVSPVYVTGVVTSNGVTVGPGGSWSPRNSVFVNCTFVPNFLANFQGKKVKITYNVTYQTNANGLTHSSEGEVYTQVR